MSETIFISSREGLLSALNSAKGGETFALAGGDYGNLLLIDGRQGTRISFPSEVTITSADPERPAVFSGLDVRGGSNLTFDGVIFDYTFAKGDPISIRPFAFTGSSNITIRNSVFDGDLARGMSEKDNGFGVGRGLEINNSNGVVLEGNEFFNFHRGLLISHGTDIRVINNDVHSIRSDGMNFAAITGAVIEGNHIHDFSASRASADHADMIQFWTNGTTIPNTDIVIRGNILDAGEGNWTQSIFMRNDMVDRGLAGKEMFYRDILIEDNVIVNGHAHGITVGETSGLVIRNNSVLHYDGNELSGVIGIPRISVSATSTDVQVTGNITSAINGWSGQAGWVVGNNAFVQDQNPLKPGWYGDVFVSSSLGVDESGAHNFIILPGSEADRLGAGASANQLSFLADAAARFHVVQDSGNPSIRHFDASASTGFDGSLPKGTIYEWDFGDGTRATGEKASHAYADGGYHGVTLTLRLPGGAILGSSHDVAVAGARLLGMDADGNFVSYGYGGGPSNLPDAGGTGLRLGAPGVTASVAHSRIADLLTANEFQIDMALSANKVGAAGELFRIHTSSLATISSKGELELQLWNDEGQLSKFSTRGAGLNDGKVHDISIQLQDGRLSILVDRQVLGEGGFDGTMRVSSENLVFGNPWGKVNFDGNLSAFDLSINQSHYGEAAEIWNSEHVFAQEIYYPELILEQEPHLPELVPGESFQILDLGLADTFAADGLRLGASGVTASVAHSRIADLLEADEFQIDMALSANKAGAAGELFRIHVSSLATISSKGELELQLWNDEGQSSKFSTRGAGLNDGAAHDISIQLQDGRISILVDRQVLGEGAFAGTLNIDSSARDLTFGNPWGRVNFDGKLSAFDIILNQNDQVEAAWFQGDQGLWQDPDAIFPPQDDDFPGDWFQFQDDGHITDGMVWA